MAASGQRARQPKKNKRRTKRRNPLVAFTRWLYRRRSNIIVVAAIGLIFFGLFGVRFITIARLLQEKQALTAQLAEEKTRTVRLDETVDQLNTRSFIEYIAHKNLHLYYPDERIIVQVKNKNAVKKTSGKTQSTTQNKSEN